MNNIARRLALPLLSAGFIGGAALGLAGTASAEVSTTTTNGHHAIVATPTPRRSRRCRRTRIMATAITTTTRGADPSQPSTPALPGGMPPGRAFLYACHIVAGMDFAMSAKGQEYHERLTDFMTEFVFPAEESYDAYRLKAGPDDHTVPPVVEELKVQGQGARPVESVPAVGVGADQPGVRAAGGVVRVEHGVGPRGAQLRGPRHREHGDTASVRQRASSASSGSSRCSTGRSAARSR